MKKKLFSGKVNIFYGQFYIDGLDFDEDDYLDMESAFQNQSNGLCGAGHEGKLFFITGPQDGTAWVTVELHESEPGLHPDCQDIVECAFSAGKHDLHLCEWANEETYPLNLPKDEYLVRYSVSNMDSDYTEDDDWDSPIDGQEYIIQLWPGSRTGDRVLRSDTETGRYWHNEIGQS